MSILDSREVGNDKRIKGLSDKAKKLPLKPGVYRFIGKKGEILYVGRATLLRRRVQNYFTDRIDDRIKEMVGLARDIKFIETDSVLEAIILEANLIKKYWPKYNVKDRDDRSFIYIVISKKDDFPKPMVLRGRQIENRKSEFENSYVFGPYQSLTLVNHALKIIRGIFPYSTCKPFNPSSFLPLARGGGRNVASHKSITPSSILPFLKGVPPLRRGGIYSPLAPPLSPPPEASADRRKLGRHAVKGEDEGGVGTFLHAKGVQGKPCFYYQIGLCPGVCVGKISKKDYAKNIKNIVLLLSGEKKRLLAKLKKENPDKIKALKHIQDVALLSEFAIRNPQSANWINRIEGYDISHFAGRETYGSMVVFENGQPNNSEYRLFKIKVAPRNDDLRALEETLSRRLSHNEWSMPDIIMIDGGRPQVDFISKLFQGKNISIPLVGISKFKNDELVFPARTKPAIREIISGLKPILLKIRDEAHRFANKASGNRRRKRFGAK